MERYSGTIRFKTEIGFEKRAIQKIFKHVYNAYEFEKFSIWPDIILEERNCFVSNLVSSKSVIMQFYDYISNLNLSTMPDDPFGKVDVTGLILTKDE